MQKLTLALLLSAALLSGCGADQKEINGKVYQPFGLFDMLEFQDPKIKYKVSGWSVLWSVLFFQTLAAPIYFIGFDLYEPVGPKDEVDANSAPK